MKRKTLFGIVLCWLSLSVFAQPRIISAGSSVTEIIYALEAESSLVAIDLSSRSYDPGGKLPQVGYLRQLSSEGLLALAPSHLLGSYEMGPDSTLTQLSASGVKVQVVASGDEQQDLLQRIDEIADVLGKQQAAITLKQQLVTQWQSLAQSPLSDSPKVVFAMLSKGRPATVAGSETTIDKIIHLAGGSNPFASQMQSYKPVGFEALVEIQPAYLLVSQRAWDSLGGMEGILAHFPLLAATPAAANKRIVPIASSAIIGGLGIESLNLATSLQQQFISDGEQDVRG